VNSQPGLVEALVGTRSLEEILATDPRSGARFVPAGKPAPNPCDLLGSPQMKRFLARLAEDHDFVILDSPPVLAVSDARVLARAVDRIVFLARWAGTRRERVIASWRQGRRRGAHSRRRQASRPVRLQRLRCVLRAGHEILLRHSRPSPRRGEGRG
jgi:Mrp family chromosome partitioning ATPase